MKNQNWHSDWGDALILTLAYYTRTGEEPKQISKHELNEELGNHPQLLNDWAARRMLDTAIISEAMQDWICTRLFLKIVRLIISQREVSRLQLFRVIKFNSAWVNIVLNLRVLIR
jgi:hypothetical protein